MQNKKFSWYFGSNERENVKSKCQNSSREIRIISTYTTHFATGLLRYPGVPGDQCGEHGRHHHLPLPVHPCHDIRHDMNWRHNHRLMTS